MVHFVSLDINGAERPCRAEVLARSASYATFAVDNGDSYYIRQSGGSCDVQVTSACLRHSDGTGRAVTCAIVAAVTVGDGNAVACNPNGVTYVNGSLFLFGKGLNGTRGTDLSATRTFWPAVAPFERHLRLHETQRVGGGAQYIIRTSTDAQLAGCAVTRQVMSRHRARRSDKRKTMRCLFILKYGQSAIHLHPGLRHGNTSRGHQSARKESTTIVVNAIIACLFARLCAFGDFRQSGAQFDRIEMTYVDAVAAHHTTRGINGTRLEVDGRSLAVLLAQRAVAAFVLIEPDAEDREPREQGQYCADGADSVAICASVAPSEYGRNDECKQRHHEGGYTAHPNIHRGKQVTVVTRLKSRQTVLQQVKKRTEEGGDHSSVCGIGRKESGNGSKADDEADEEYSSHGVSQHFLFRGERVAVVPLLFTEPPEDVLHHAKRTDDAAIYPAEDKSEQDKSEQNSVVKGKQGGDELYFCSPCNIVRHTTSPTDKQ